MSATDAACISTRSKTAVPPRISLPPFLVEGRSLVVCHQLSSLLEIYG